MLVRRIFIYDEKEKRKYARKFAQKIVFWRDSLKCTCTLRSHLFIYKCERFQIKRIAPFFLFFFHFIVLFLQVSLNGDAFIILNYIYYFFLFLKRWYARYACPCMSERALIHYQRKLCMCASVCRSVSPFWCYYFIYSLICRICCVRQRWERVSESWFVPMCECCCSTILPLRLFLDCVCEKRRAIGLCT